MKNLENPKTPPIDDLTPTKGKVSKKKEASHELVMAPKKKEHFKKKISTQVNGEITKPIIKTPHTAKYFPKDHEVNNEPSRTVPNQSMTILEMVKRHQQGLPIEGSKGIPLYSGEELIPDLSGMDLADKQEYIDSVADHLVEVRARIDAAKKEAAEAAKLKEFEAWRKEQENKLKAEHDLANTTQKQKKAES